MKTLFQRIGLIGATAAGLALMAAAGLQNDANKDGATETAKPEPAASAKANDPALDELHGAFVKGYNSGDADALGELFTDDAEVIDSAGVVTRGRADIVAMYAEGFKQAKGLKLDSTVESVRKLTGDVARVAGQSVLTGSGTAPTSQANRFAALLVKREGRWRVAELRDDPTSPAEATPYDHLREMEWMVGDWVDEGGNTKVHSSVRWAVNQSFLIRTYFVEVKGEPAMAGTMFIGWDPQTGQIKSWMFDSSGGHGEGLWTHVAENRWVVKSGGVTLDGRPNSATLVHTIVGKDSVKTSSIDRIIGGEVAPDILDVLMVRQPPDEAKGPAPAERSKEAAPDTAKPK